MSTVAVTGVSGYLGRKVLEALEGSEDVSRVVGIDLIPPATPGRKLEFYELDARSPELGGVVAGSQVLVHLAAAREGPADELRDGNIGGARSVAEAAVRAGVGKVVLASTYRVYGAHADNDFPLTETSVLRPSPGDSFGRSMVEAESVLRYLGESHPEVQVTILRMAWMCGPTLPTVHARPVDAPVRPVLDGYKPPFQVLGEDDGGRAVVHALENDVPGVFNVCADDWVESPEEILGQRRLRIGTQRPSRKLAVLGRLRVPVPPGGVGALMYPQVMSNQTYRSAGFRFSQTTVQALEEAALARREWTAVGPVRFRPRRAALVAGTLGAVAATSAVRRGRRRRRRQEPGA